MSKIFTPRCQKSGVVIVGAGKRRWTRGNVERPRLVVLVAEYSMIANCSRRERERERETTHSSMCLQRFAAVHGYVNIFKPHRMHRVHRCELCLCVSGLSVTVRLHVAMMCWSRPYCMYVRSNYSDTGGLLSGSFPLYCIYFA